MATTRSLGPFYDLDGVSRFLRRTPDDVREAGNSLELLTMLAGDGTPVFLTWQFTATVRPVPRLDEVLAVLSGGTSKRWMWALWLSAIDDDLDQKSAGRWLTDGGDPAPVPHEAAADAAWWRT